MWRNIIAVAVVSVALAASWEAFQHKADLGSRSLEGPTNLIVARADLQPGTVITEAMLEMRGIPKAYMQQGAYEVRMPSDMLIPVGLTVAVRIPKGDQLTQNCLAETGKKAPAKPAFGARQQSMERYQEGLKYFQNNNYEKARAEWREALKLDPKNADAAAGLKRIEQIQAPTR